MAKASVLQFKDYTVEEILFKNVPVSGDKHEFELHPHFKRELTEIGENQYDLKLAVEMISTKEHPMPFDLRISLIGHFALEDESGEVSEELKNSILKNNTVAILFPFLRAIVASVTTNANIPSLVLPIMNFADNTAED